VSCRNHRLTERAFAPYTQSIRKGTYALDLRLLGGKSDEGFIRRLPRLRVELVTFGRDNTRHGSGVSLGCSH
jgi:hypothetical protein